MIIESIFRKNPNDITYSDIEDFFASERSESDTIEFKSSSTSESLKEKEKGVIKTISAFLNSSGGVLIWGAPIGREIEGQKEKVFTGELTPVDKVYEKDPFINKITDSIVPFPSGILFHRIQSEKGSIYLIEVEKSQYSPHQFSNGYYMRIDGQTRPAPHHYIEALFKRITFPNLLGGLESSPIIKLGNRTYIKLNFAILNASANLNEPNLNYSVITHSDETILIDNKDYTHKKTMLDSQSIYGYVENYQLAYGGLYTISEYLDITELKRIFFTLEFRFGGKHSPQKICQYRLVPTNKSTCTFHPIFENIFAFDHINTLNRNGMQDIIIGIFKRNIITPPNSPTP